MNLKEQIIKRLTELGADIKNLTFKYFEKSPYQLKRYKPEFVEQECWIFVQGMKEGYVLTEEGFNNIEYRDNYLEMIIAESKNY